MEFEQWVLEQNKKNNTFIKLIRTTLNNKPIYIIRESDGYDINEIIINKKLIKKINNIIK
tara:strand:+ start:278 stop:457 length:180 start_codon:yes stop_codon:yes gene_type:complete